MHNRFKTIVAVIPTFDGFMNMFMYALLFWWCGVLVAGFSGCNQPDPAELLSSSTGSDVVNDAIRSNNGHHAEFYQDETGACSWLIVNGNGVVVATLEILK